MKNMGKYNREKKREYYEANKEKILAYSKARYKNKSEYYKDLAKKYRKKNYDKCRAAVKKYYELNKESINKKSYETKKRKGQKQDQNKMNAYARDRYKKDPEYRIRRILRSRLNSITRYGVKSGSAVKDLGCSTEEFKSYIESKWLTGMSWENYGTKGWHIDHIKPLCLFNLENREEFLEAVNYKNMQPLWAEDNHKKGKRYVER